MENMNDQAAIALLDDYDETIAEYKQFQGHISTIAEEEMVLPIEVDFMFWDE